MASEDPVVICSSARTPLGRFGGELAALTAVQLGAVAIAAALDRAAVRREAIGEIFMGCVLPAGLGQAPARQAARGAGIPDEVGATTINKVCGSGMKAAMLAHDTILAGSATIAVAGGMESMSGAPYLLDKARSGYRAGHGRVLDHMMLDGLEDAYQAGRSMGSFAEDSAEAYQFTRDAQDRYAAETLRRARAAGTNGAFSEEIAAIPVAANSAAPEMTSDELPRRLDPGRIFGLKPASRPDGTITAASSSAIADGAAALVLARRSAAERIGLPMLAEIKAHATHSQAPEWFATAPAPAIRKVLERAGWQVQDVDLFEINEAFAVVTMAAICDLGLDPDCVNVNGGACALCHPIGASGARIILTLLHALKSQDLKRGVAALCIGGGEATAIAVERLA